MSRRASLTVVVAAMLAMGCGESEPGPEEEEDVPIEGSLFSTLQAKFAGQVLAGGVELAAFQYGSQIPESSINNQCTTISGDPTDDDGDKIPVSGVLTLDCNKRLLGWSGSVKGTQSVTDTQPEAAAWSFTMSADLDASVSGPFGGSADSQASGSIAATQGGALGPYSLDILLGASTDITTATGLEFSVTEDIDWSMTYTPDLDWSPGGGIVVTGVLDVGGTWTVNVNGDEAEATLSTPTPLVFDPTCRPTRVTAGVVEASFEYQGKTAVIRVEWTGCDRSRVTYDHDV